MPNEALVFSNIPFSVTALIDRAPHWTMIRELSMNAIEAKPLAKRSFTGQPAVTKACAKP
jgi:hypothetical protein